MSEIVTKCPFSNGLECNECRLKDYIGNRCFLFAEIDAKLILAKEIKELKEAIKGSASKTNSLDQIFEEAASFRDATYKRSALEYGRCREADQLTNGDDLPF